MTGPVKRAVPPDSDPLVDVVGAINTLYDKGHRTDNRDLQLVALRLLAACGKERKILQISYPLESLALEDVE